MREKNFPLMTLLKLQLIINITRSQRKTEKTVILKFTTSLQPASSKPPPERIQLLKEVRGLGFEYLSGIELLFKRRFSLKKK
jgi:hypothetical protein